MHLLLMLAIPFMVMLLIDVGHSQFCVNCANPNDFQCNNTFWSKMHTNGYIYIVSTEDDPIFNNTDLSSCMPKGHKIEFLESPVCIWAPDIGIHIITPDQMDGSEMIDECVRCQELTPCTSLRTNSNNRIYRFWFRSLLIGVCITISKIYFMGFILQI
ncbi:uncharacterized protein LOC124460142 [Drosophila willistoni]|uniref:uncharacterized protein LOC124460142 n=1 Tax=Drosophila willistoni TaxID=7260 RepID=UPI001F07C485|nr:uncharacterized protein LOC124460142 [Drosophila willistoni]